MHKLRAKKDWILPVSHGRGHDLTMANVTSSSLTLSRKCCCTELQAFVSGINTRKANKLALSLFQTHTLTHTHTHTHTLTHTHTHTPPPTHKLMCSWLC